MNIKELAEQAGYLPDMFGVGHWDSPELKRFAELFLEQERKEAAEHYLKLIRDCVATEREACAVECDKWAAVKPASDFMYGSASGAEKCAAAIRARGDKHD